jgi:hypothetical protein
LKNTNELALFIVSCKNIKEDCDILSKVGKKCVAIL